MYHSKECTLQLANAIIQDIEIASNEAKQAI